VRHVAVSSNKAMPGNFQPLCFTAIGSAWNDTQAQGSALPRFPGGRLRKALQPKCPSCPESVQHGTHSDCIFRYDGVVAYGPHGAVEQRPPTAAPLPTAASDRSYWTCGGFGYQDCAAGCGAKPGNRRSSGGDEKHADESTKTGGCELGSTPNIPPHAIDQATTPQRRVFNSVCFRA
jgi:hypothetical protein